MDNFQRNTIKSFRRAKEDIRNLQAQITEMNRKHEEIMELISEQEYKPERAKKEVPYKSPKKK